MILSTTCCGGNFAGGYTYDLFNRQKTYTPDGLVYTTTTYRPDGLRHSIGSSRNNVDYSISAQKNATNLMNEKYGIGNWHSGPGTEFNKIAKWLQRCLGVK